MFLIAQLLLLVVAVVVGGATAMAAAVAEAGTDAADPNEGQPLEGAVKDAIDKGIEQPGAAATGSAITQAELADNAVHNYVSEFQAHKYPLHTDFMRLANQVKVDTKEPEDFVISDAILEFKFKSTYDGSGKATEADIAGNLYANDKKLLAENWTLLLNGVEGYDENGNPDGSPLMLIVIATNKSRSEIIVEACNGPINNGEVYVPSIPAGTEALIMAPALSESEVEVSPDAFYPQPEKCYLQKKVCAITYTEFFERINKKAQWRAQDIKNKTLDTFRKKCTRSMLIGAGTKRVKANDKTGNEYQYTQRGILRQLRLGFQIEDAWSVEHLVGIAKTYFGKYATTNEVDIYTGPNAMERLANIDFSKHPEIQIQQSTNELNIGITKVITVFGTLNFKLEHALEDIKMSDYAIAFSMKESDRFYYEKGKTITIDHEKGEGGETREAKSEYYIQDDCLQLKGYNSMLIGPNVAKAGYRNIDSVVNTGTTFPESPKEGDVFYLTAAADGKAIGLYQFEDGKWESFNGVLNA